MTLECAIATPHGLATEAGRDAVRSGGNAIDAALAAAAVLTVVYPHMCSIGGDLFALVGLPGEEPVAIDGSGAAAAATDPDALARQHGSMPIRGVDTVTVPGILSGWEAIADLGSARGPAGYIEAASAYARDGVPVAPSLAEAILTGRALIASDPGMQGVFTPEGRALAAGDPLVQPKLAESLDLIAEEGAEVFYRGVLGEQFVYGMRRLGSAIERDDLAGHRASRTESLSLAFGGQELFTNPPPSQGIAFLQTLKLIAASGRDDLLGSGADLLAWIAWTVAADRDRYLADPNQVDVPVEELLSDQHIDGLLELVRSGPENVAPASPARPRPTGDTVAITSVDSEGRAVSIIQSIFHSFGSGILEPSTGIICQNRGACFTLDPGSPNRISAGKRPAHTLMPVLVRDGAGRLSAHGTMGGRAQPQIHAQVLLRRLAGADPRQAVAAPRFVVGGLDAGSERDVIFAEHNLEPSAAEALAGAGLELRTEGELDEIVGHFTLAANTADGLAAAADPRSDGGSFPGDEGRS